MKKVISVVMTVAVMMFSVANAEVSGNLSTKFLPQYVGGDGAVAYDQEVVQTNLFIILPNSIYFDFLGSKSFTGQNYGNELDFTAGYSKEDFNVGISYWNLLPVDTLNKDDMLSPYAEIYKKVGGGFTPFAKVEVLIPLDGSKKKIRTHGGTKHFWQATEKIAISQKLSAVYVSGTSDSKEGLVARHDIGLSWFATKDFSVDISNNSYIPLNKTDRKTQVVPGIGATYHF